MANRMKLAAAVLLGGGVAACAGGAVDQAYLGTYDPATLNYVASKGALYTQVIGNPFEAPQADLERAVTRSMTGSHSGQPVQFSTDRDPANPSPYRVVVMFNPGPGSAPNKLCQGAGESAAGSGDRIKVVAALCAGDSRETSVTGRIAGASGPNDPAFQGLIRQMTAQLFPRENDNLRGPNDFDT